MKITKFKITIILIYFFLIIGIVILTYFNNIVDFQIIKIKINDVDIQNIKEIGIRDQQLKIYFNRPFRINNNEKMIKIYPETEFVTKTSASILKIEFIQNLDYNTQYRIEFLENLVDIFDNKLSRNKEIYFKTKNPEILYIERNYPNQKDKIIKLDLSNFTTKKILTDKLIKQISANKKYVSYINVLNSEYEDICYINFIESNPDSEKKCLNLEKFLIKKIQVHPNENKIFFIGQKQQEIDNYSGNRIKIPDLNNPHNNLYIYDINTNDLTKKLILDYNTDILDLKISKSGKYMLVKLNDVNNPGYYYLINTNDLTKIQPLNSFLSLQDFNFLENQIIGVNFNRLNTYDSTGNLVQTIDQDLQITDVINNENLIFDVIYKNKTPKIIFSQKYQENESFIGLFEIKIFDLTTKEDSSLLKEEGFSLENPKISSDDNFLVVEKFTNEQIEKNTFDISEFKIKRDFVFHFKPGRGNILIYSLKENKLIKEITNSINPIFID